jgi:hypothetical protein
MNTPGQQQQVPQHNQAYQGLDTSVSSIWQHVIDPRFGSQGCMTSCPCRGQLKLNGSQPKGCLSFQKKIQTPAFFVQSARGYLLQRSDGFTFRWSGRMEEERPSMARLSLSLHAPGLTLVPHATACLLQHVFLPPFGNHMSFQKDLG